MTKLSMSEEEMLKRKYTRPYEERIAELEDKLANADYQLEGRDIEIKELEAQIEKMKNCFNCAKGDWNNRVECIKSGCVNKNKWEIKEK